MHLTKEQFLQREKAASEEQFQEFMSNPTIRLLISMIPATENRDVLHTLLKETFSQAFSRGSLFFAITAMDGVIESLLKKDKRP